MPSDPLIVIARLVQIFDDLQIQYVVGGSMASSIYGVPRATQDVDVMASVKLQDVDRLTSALEEEFYVSDELIVNAIRRKSPFNVVHLPTMFKADVFIAEDTDWSREEMRRARTEVVLPDEGFTVRFSSPEDSILLKLLWYGIRGQESERQWNDVLGILRIQADSLDFAYLERWAAHLKIDDLLMRSRRDATLEQN